MRQRRQILESRKSIAAAALVACCCIPAVVQAQEPGRTMVIKEPTGWFGVRISDTAMMTDEGTAFFDAYPVVTQVDPNSPASKAGVQVGDVLLMFNNHDMRGGSIELAQWLKVGAPFVLKIRRKDRTRVLTGTLAKRPAKRCRKPARYAKWLGQPRTDERYDERSNQSSNTGAAACRSRARTRLRCR